MIYKRSILGVCTIFLGLTGLSAQSGFTATGGDYTGSAGATSFAVGQLGYQSYTSNTGSADLGVIHPYETLILLKIEDYDKDFQFSVYPNPTQDFLILQSKGGEDLNYGLYDLQGRLLLTEKINQDKSVLSMADLPTAPYLLKIFKSSKPLKTFKLIKN